MIDKLKAGAKLGVVTYTNQEQFYWVKLKDVEKHLEELKKKLKETIMFPVDNDGSTLSDMKDDFNKGLFEKIEKAFHKEAEG